MLQTFIQGFNWSLLLLTFFYGSNILHSMERKPIVSVGLSCRERGLFAPPLSRM